MAIKYIKADQPETPTTPVGSDGASAYEIAVSNGFVGSEPAWLFSLKGESGDNGISIQGPPGAPGEAGESGVAILDNRIVVKQSSDFGVIDSTKEYFLDGIIDMGATSIVVPTGGIYISGYNFDISGLTSTALNYKMFTSPVGGSGNILFNDFHIDVSGTTSQVYDITSNSGFEAIEVSRINYNNCTSLGELDGYRQGLETGTGRFGGTPNLILSGTWLGGYFIETSIVRSLADGAYALFEEGASFIMNSRFRSNANVDLNSLVAYIDFNVANFTNPNTFQLESGLVTRNGVVNSADTNLVPNILASDLISKWKGNVGLTNTFVGGEVKISAETATVIAVVDTFVDLAGTYSVSELSHFDSPANGQLRHLGDSPKEFKVFVTGSLVSAANNEVKIKIVVWDDSLSTFVDYKVDKKIVNNLSGGRNVAFFAFTSNIILSKNDYVKLQTANVLTTNDITAEVGTSFSVEER